MVRRPSQLLLALLVLLVSACSPEPKSARLPSAISPNNHPFFPIGPGAMHELGAQRLAADGPFKCESCHPADAPSFTDVSCTSCHGHSEVIAARLHAQTPMYAPDARACVSCHPASDHKPFDHAGVTDDCAMCHQESAPFAALPVADFTHPEMNGADCSSCHVITSWKNATGAPAELSADPARDLHVQSLVPTYSGFDISLLTPVDQVLPMTMNHGSPEVPAADCASCHLGAGSGTFLPGTLHRTVATQPSRCASCHANARPAGFVGPTATSPARTPPSPEMKHDAVQWANGAPTSIALVSADCGLCHLASEGSWAAGRLGTSPALYHSALAAAGEPQPVSCVDCHANSRPRTVLTSSNSSLVSSLEFDHGSAAGEGDCSGCHTLRAPFSSWAQGVFHAAGSATPSSCGSCHAAGRPTSFASWTNPAFTTAPFDYVTNANNIPHGAGLDCVTCHAGPGTGQWGVDQNWASGHFTHGPNSLSATTCISCHATQRPDLVLGRAQANTVLGFDHALNGSGDCFGCHQATVLAGSYASFFNPSTSTLPNGDWKGGVAYPGSTYASSTTQSVTVTELTLHRSGANNLVTSISSSQATLHNGMLHTSPRVPAALNAGPTGAPDSTKCWHCHTSTGTTVTSFNDGKFHEALTRFRATPTGAIVPFPQPTQGCSDCHAPGRPTNIVQRAGAALFSMDHSAAFAQAVMLGGQSVTAVDQVDCSVCHRSPGTSWNDGVFHASIGSAQPAECVSCHFPLMAEAATADVARAPSFTMKHRSAQLTTQRCEGCHATALSKASTTPVTASSWTTGALHPSLTTQPGACVDCHGVSQPSGLTQGTVVWPLSQGATPTNTAMWMNHASTFVAGRDCSVCHAADAKVMGSAWNKGSLLHAPVPAVTSCAGCHGVVPGVNNNVPQGLIDSSTLTSASAPTGVAGRAAQLTHADPRDCRACHTSVSDWKAADFHRNVSGNTSRCSSCHLNLKPGPGYLQQDHSTFTAAPSSQDCGSCHTYPGTGTAAAPNWLGASGAPSSMSVGGFGISAPPASTATTQAVMSLPHPTGALCTSCHATSGGGRNAVGYDHGSALISTHCASCHEAGSDLVGTPWTGTTGDTRPFTLASLSVSYGAGMTVSAPNHFYPVDCGQCHLTPAGTAAVTSGATWLTRWRFPHDEAAMSNPATCVLCHVGGIPGAPDGGVADPNRDVTVNSLLPRFSGTSITSVTAQTTSWPMTMLHTSPEFPAAANSACSNCHQDAATGVYFPGSLHGSLADLGLAQPSGCSSCHAPAPSGFVGPLATNPPRVPSTPAMRHEAVRWSNGAPTTTALVSGNCTPCHASPSATLQASWATAPDGGAVKYHASLAAQPSSCLDCHANSRPAAVLTSATGVEFDHRTTPAQADCAGCHARSTVAPWASWSGGRFHLAGSPNPTSCLPCHAGARPTSTQGWASPTYAQSPFDYGTNALGVTHGNGLDCAKCHTGPGTGAWGGAPNWQGGRYLHGTSTTCIVCHTTQRPDLVLGVAQASSALGFDHAANGTGDCIGCHQATITANTYARYFNATTGTLPNGDWKGGQQYPGSTLVSAPNRFVTVTQTALQRNAANLVTGSTSTTATLQNAMLHVSSVLPAALNAGPTGSPDGTKCWHCHTHSGTTVTSFANGEYHASLSGYSATPSGPVTPLPQPTSGCRDCHSGMDPANIVMKAGSVLQPMDHSARFTTAVTLGGASVTAVDQLDCSVCHRSPGTTWADGQFHLNIAGATPSDCVSCHYPLMADAAKSDLTNGTRYAMKHRSAALTTQACGACHASALGRATAATPVATLWQTGALHAGVGSSQPGACVDCHSVSDPPPNASTQSSVTYALTLGGTATNGGQWLNHGAASVAGKDCVVCHAADARPSGAAWSKATLLHPRASTVTPCAACHGVSNGRGTVIGTNNNLPLGLTNSPMVSSAAGVTNTGIPAGTRAQITHADINVTAFDCGTCHTQKGASTTAGIQGKEWAQGTFHSHFTGATPLVMNTTTGRCSNCHLNVKPGTAYPAQDHSAFTATSGTQDCSACHSFPGTGTVAAPNWQGAAGMPMYIPVGGFTIPVPPATTANKLQTGISNLPHPPVASGVACTTCHATASGGRRAFGYPHASSTLINANCNACHEAGTDLLGTRWNGATTASSGAGDSRPFTLTSVTPSFKGNTTSCAYLKHFYPVDCKECHAKPAGNGFVTTGSAYTTAWRFVHATGAPMTRPATCDMCHSGVCNL